MSPRPVGNVTAAHGIPGRRSSDICMYDDDCMDEPSGRFTIPLCDSHAVHVHELVEMSLAMEELRAGARERRAVSPTRTRLQRQVRDLTPHPVVYYVRFGDMVKIGFSTNVRSRLQAIPHQEVLAVKDGTMADERAAHRACAEWRLVGEWFQDCPEFRAAAGLDTPDSRE